VPAAMPQPLWQVKIELATKELLADGITVKWTTWPGGGTIDVPVNNVPGGGGTVNWQQAGPTSLANAPAGLHVSATLRKKVGNGDWINAAHPIHVEIP